MRTTTNRLTLECLLKEVHSGITMEKALRELIWSKKFLTKESETLVRNPMTYTIRSFNYHQWWNLVMNRQLDLKVMVMYRAEEMERDRNELIPYHQLVKFIKVCQWVQQIWLWIKLAVQEAWIMDCLRGRASMIHLSLKSRVLALNNSNRADLATIM